MAENWRARAAARNRRQQEVRARALDEPSPDDGAAVQQQRRYNSLRRTQSRAGIWLTAVVTVVFAVLFSVTTARPLVIAVCVVWVVVSGWFVPTRLFRAQLALDQAWADPQRQGLRTAAARAAKWALLNIVTFIGGLFVVFVVVSATRH